MPRRTDEEAPPANALEALERAGRHARRAGVELVAAAHAVLDAASLGWNGQTSDENETLRALAAGLDELGDRLERGDAWLPQPVTRAVITAIDGEIARWQQRSETDPDARSVLRAFLSIREILWELGLRGAGSPEAAPSPGDSAPRSKQTRARSAATRDEGGASGHATASRPNAREAGAGAPRARRLSRVKPVDGDVHEKR